MDADLRRRALDAALVAAMDAAAAQEMVWGRDDCGMWCAGVLLVALGYDAADCVRGRYRTRIGAKRVLGRPWLAGFLRSAARRHGWRRIKRGEQVGDMGLALLDGVSTTVICRAPGWFVGRNEAGFTAVPASAVRLMWAVI